jgi:hypothetical protein
MAGLVFIEVRLKYASKMLTTERIKVTVNFPTEVGSQCSTKQTTYELGRGGICLGINYSVLNETKRYE